MIGRPLQKINKIPLADDYNKVIEVLQPLQNLNIGTGLNGYITSNGISISVAKTGGASEFDHPFKVESDSLSSATIQFGRVFEERNFQGSEVSTITNLSFIELSSSVTFDTLTGMTLDLNSTLERDSIIIAVDSTHESSLDKKFYSVCLSSSITPDYYPAHIIANLTKETSGAGSWTIEQVLMGDYTFDRNPPVPFDITRYGDKWLIYLPSGSLVINGTDLTNDILYLTQGRSAIIGDWYEIIQLTYNYIQIYYYNVSPTPGYGYGKPYGAQVWPGADDGFKMYEYDGNKITKQLIKGAYVVDKIRPDSGDSSSKYKSIAVQGSDDGILPSTNDFTLELHGFKAGTEILEPIGYESSYTHKVPIREEYPGGDIVLRWTDASNLMGVTEVSGDVNVNETTTGELSGLNVNFNYPFRTSITSGADGVNIILGRVYEAKAFEYNTTGGELEETPYPLLEYPYQGTELVGQTVTIGSLSEDYVVVYKQNVGYYTDCEKFYIGYENSLPVNYYKIQRIAKVYLDGSEYKVEQIHMGDVTANDMPIAPFTVAKTGGGCQIYLPPKSLVINGTDYTANINGYGPMNPGLLSYADWYAVSTESGNLYLYIYMTNDPQEYGRPYALEISYSPSYSFGGERIDIPIFDFNLRRQYVFGAINREIIRTDGSRNQTNGRRFSLSDSIEGGSGDKTMQLWNFSNAAGPLGNLDGSDGYDYTFPIREYESGNDNAEIKYAAYSSLSASIAESITSDTTIISGIFNEFWTWYDNLSSTEFSGRGFWEKGANNTINYGASIGDSNAVKVIDLDTRTLETSAWNFNTLMGDNVETNNVTTTTLTLSTYQLYLHPDGTVRWQ